MELNPDAVRDAVQNLKMNDVKNISSTAMTPDGLSVNMAEKGEKVDVILMDPQEAEVRREFIDAVAKMGPRTCGLCLLRAGNLLRDLRWFMGNGYRAVEAWPVDMFGGTGHVETVVLLERKSPVNERIFRYMGLKV